VSKPGLSPRVVRDGVIDPVAWDRAVACHELVGNCPACGGVLHAIEDRPVVLPHPGYRIDYTARCGACGHEIVAPGGRLRTSTTAKSRRTKAGN